MFDWILNTLLIPIQLKGHLTLIQDIFLKFYALDNYTQTYEKFFHAGQFNTEEKPCLSEFLTSYDAKS